ncbi:MAG: hypothetical protein QJR01_01875 [Kyrpidia sp.]|nr:hypothetical protein [Kyrpidia sp.]
MWTDLRGLPHREIDGLPYTVHQAAPGRWHIVIQNCPRHPTGHFLPLAYPSREAAMAALEEGPPWKA